MFNHVISNWKRYGVGNYTWNQLVARAAELPVIVYSKGPSFNSEFDQTPYADHFKIGVNQAGLEVKNVDVIIGRDLGIRELIIEQGFCGPIITAMKPEWLETWETNARSGYEFVIRVMGEMGIKEFDVIGHDHEGFYGFDYPKSYPDQDEPAEEKLKTLPRVEPAIQAAIDKYEFKINNLAPVKEKKVKKPRRKKVEL